MKDTYPIQDACFPAPLPQYHLAIIELTKQVKALADKCGSHVAYCEDGEYRERLMLDHYRPIEEACDGILKSLGQEK